MRTFQLVSMIFAAAATTAAAAATKPGEGGDDGYPLAGTPTAGSFWSIYNATDAPAYDKCLVMEGEMVDDACCMSEMADMLPHADLQGPDTCFSLGPGLVPFSGCVDDGVAGYGENCSGEGAPFAAEDAEACGCSFVIEGSGCYKANDIPGQQWFVYLDGDSCMVEKPMMMMMMRMMGKAMKMMMSEGMSVKGKGSKGSGMDPMPMSKGSGMDAMSKGSGMDTMSKGKGMDTMMSKGKGMDSMSKGKGMDSMSKGKGMDSMSKGMVMKRMGMVGMAMAKGKA